MLKVETELEDGPGVENAIGTDAPPPAPQLIFFALSVAQTTDKTCAALR